MTICYLCREAVIDEIAYDIAEEDMNRWNEQELAEFAVEHGAEITDHLCEITENEDPHRKIVCDCSCH